MSKKHKTTSFRSLPRTASSSEIRSSASELGEDPIVVERMMEFISRIEREIESLELSPEMVSNCAVTLLATSLLHCPEDRREAAVASIFTALWDHLGLKPH
jgi:hypothetical protein